MMRKSTLLFLAIWLNLTLSVAQSLPIERRSDWQNAGRQTPIPDYPTILNILDFGGMGDSATLNETPFQLAVDALQGQSGAIFFPEGKYLFHHAIQLRDSLIVRGDGAERSALFFDLGSAYQNCIVSSGSILPDSNAVLLTQNLAQGDTILHAESNLQPGDFVRFQFDDSLVIFSPWAFGNAGQLLEVVSANNGEIRVNHSLRLDCDLALRPRLRKIDPVDDAGLECLKIKRLDPNVPIGSNILFNHVRRCWLVGVESEVCNFSHFTFEGSAHCEVYGCYAHDAFAYGGGGQGYGLVFQFTAGDNRAQNNIFKHLRHSMLLQSGANGNVLSYNFSTEPFWENIPSNGSGEIALHGNFPSHNLFEGNICENIRPDGSHGNNGPFNTLFRNRTSGYGIIMTAPEFQHYFNVAGNEIVSGSIFQGFYIVDGTDHFEQGNSQNGNITPAGTPVQTDTSLYFSAVPSFLSGTNFLIGPPSTFNSATIPAKERFFSGNKKTDCEARSGMMVVNTEPQSTTVQMNIFPNPATAEFVVFLDTPGLVEIFDIAGKTWFTESKIEETLHINCRHWPIGLYLVRVKNKESVCTKLVLKSS